MAESYTTKDITTVGEVNELEITDKVFVNDSDSLKQISLSNLMDSSGALKKNQGAENSGKSLIVGEDGNVVLGEKPVKVDSTLSQSGQAADAKATGDRISALSIHQTVSGESLQIEDSADAPMAGLRVFGKSRQAQTTGAQLFNITYGSETKNGITVKREGGVVTVTGTPTITTGYSSFIIGNTTIVAGEYTVSVDKKFIGIGIQFPHEPNGVLNLTMEGTLTSKSKEITSGSEGGNIVLNVDNTKGALNYTGKFMLNSGSTALPFEPYTGGKPSPSSDYPQEIEIPGSEGSVGVNVTGAQLAPINKAKSNEGITVSFNSDGSLNITGTPNRQYISVLYEDVELEPGDYYVTSGLSEPGRMILQVVVFKPSGTKYYMNTGFTIDGTETRIVCNIIYNSATIQAINLFNFKPMLNRGSTALPWEPYHTPQKLTVQTPNGLPGIPVDSGGNYTDSDGQQWICDEVDFDRGKYVQRVKKVVYDGSEEEGWLMAGTASEKYRVGNYNMQNSVLGSESNSTKAICMCSNYQIVTENNTYTNIEGFSVDPNGLIFIYDKNYNTQNSINDYKNYLSEHPMTVIYALVIPIETDLSAEELTAYAALRTNYPTTVVTSDSDPEVGIEVEYVADTQKYIDSKFAELAQNLAATQNTLLEV